MNKKVYLMLVLSAVSLILVNLISAQTLYPAEQEMIFLTSPTNAHGATTSASGYTTNVSYENIFGRSYFLPLGGNPRICNVTNKIVRLSGTTNAHAEQVGQGTAGYTDVCYGDLICNTRMLQNCAADEKEILRLYQSTNSHLALNGTGIGQVAVCCKLPAVERIIGNLTGAHWENLVGQEINSTNVGSTVRMVVYGENLTNSQINYTIERKTTTWLIFTRWIGSSSVSTRGAGEWQPDTEGTYRFRAEVIDSGHEETSPELYVNGTASNTPPTVRITSLIDGGIYFLTNTLNFSASVSDPDDVSLTYSWNAWDGKTSAAPSFLYQYSMPGQKAITLKVTDGRGASTEAKIDILVVNSSYAFSYISSPTYGQLISGLSVTFDASQRSYLVNVTHNPDAITCLAGNCPNQSADGSVPVNNTPAPITNVNFSWKLSDNYRRTGLGNSFAVVPYQFASPGTKGAEMNVSIFPDVSSWTWTNFTLYLQSGVPYCSVSGNTSSWVTSSGSSDSRSSCYRSNGQPGTTCCPSGYSCDTSSGNCLPGGASLCSDYTTQTACNNFANSVAENSVRTASGGNITCGNVIREYQENGFNYRDVADNCRCEWVSSACQSNYNITKECVDGSCGPVNIGSCQSSISLSQDLCSTAQKVKVYGITSTWTGTGATPETCRNSTITKSCIDFSQVKLPFFSSTQLIIAIALIIAFYIYHHRKNKRQ